MESPTFSSPNSIESQVTRAVIPLLNLKQTKPQEIPMVKESPRSNHFVPSMEESLSPKANPYKDLYNNHMSTPKSTPSSTNTTPDWKFHLGPPAPVTPSYSSSLGQVPSSSPRVPYSPRIPSPRTQSPRTHNTTTTAVSTTTNNNNNALVTMDDPFTKKTDDQWRKLEYYTNDLSHFIFETLKTKDFNQIAMLSSKMSEITNTVKEIEITNAIFKKLPPQTRARKNRSTKAEKLKKDPLSVKRLFVTSPKKKGQYCTLCGTMETPEWRKGPAGHKTLCNACGLHYAKNLKREVQLPDDQPSLVSMNGFSGLEMLLGERQSDATMVLRSITLIAQPQTLRQPPLFELIQSTTHPSGSCPHKFSPLIHFHIAPHTASTLLHNPSTSFWGSNKHTSNLIKSTSTPPQ
eukprot:gene1478-1716_t